MWTPPLLSVHGDGVDRLIDVLHVFMVVLFVPWAIFFLYCLARFRRRSGRGASYELPKAKVSKYAEIAVAAFEVVLLVGFSMPVWAAYKNDPPPPDDRVEIRVVGEQFQWDFHYPGKDGKFGRTDNSMISPSNVIGLVESDPAAADDIVLVNECHLPVGKQIYVRLTSKDVIHSFDIPTMRVKQDVIPGMEIPVWFQVHEWATSDRLRQQMAQRYPMDRLNWYKIRHLVAAEEVKAPSGEVMIPRGGDFGLDIKAGREIVERLRKAGVTELVLEPRHPIEVVCAQLCGNSHFKMRAQVICHKPEDFEKWMEEASKKPELGEDF